MKYRDGVCAVICRTGSPELLVCHRVGYKPNLGWQFPQGGVDSSKDLLVELKRELREEIGTDGIEMIRISPKTYTYAFPARARGAKPGFDGQRLRWVLCRLNRGDEAIHFDHQPAEFDAFQWVTPRKAVADIVAFKREMYAEALTDFGLLRTIDQE